MCQCNCNYDVLSEDRWTTMASTDERNLIAYLFEQQSYNPLIRPVRNRSDTLQVTFEMALIQLITLVSRSHEHLLRHHHHHHHHHTLY